jgi:hypothetical protein
MAAVLVGLVVVICVVVARLNDVQYEIERLENYANTIADDIMLTHPKSVTDELWSRRLKHQLRRFPLE